MLRSMFEGKKIEYGTFRGFGDTGFIVLILKAGIQSFKANGGEPLGPY